MAFENYAWSITSPPTAEPISLTEAKLHLRVDGSTDDTLITSLIKVARQYCEAFQSRCYMATTFTLKCDEWPNEYFVIPNPPLWSVGSITYVDSAGATQTLSSGTYEVDTTSEPGQIRLAYNQSWPSIRGDHHGITITYNAGYSSNFTANGTTDVCTCAGRTFTDTARVRVRNADGGLPTNLAEATDYYIRDVSGNTFKLAASSGGAALDLTAGTGTHYIGLVPDTFIAAMKLMIAHLYENREASVETALSETPLAVKNLLWLDKVMTL